MIRLLVGSMTLPVANTCTTSGTGTQVMVARQVMVDKQQTTTLLLSYSMFYCDQLAMPVGR